MILRYRSPVSPPLLCLCVCPCRCVRDRIAYYTAHCTTAHHPLLGQVQELAQAEEEAGQAHLDPGKGAGDTTVRRYQCVKLPPLYKSERRHDTYIRALHLKWCLVRIATAAVERCLARGGCCRRYRIYPDGSSHAHLAPLKLHVLLLTGKWRLSANLLQLTHSWLARPVTAVLGAVGM